MAAKDFQYVVTTISTAPGNGRVQTVTPRKPSRRCNCGCTACSKWCRKASDSAGVVCADQKRAIMSGGLRGPFFDKRGARLIAQDHGPVTYLPFCHQAVFDVRVLACKRLGCRAFALKNQQRAIRRISERAGQHQFAASMRFARQPELLLAIRTAARNEIVDDIV